MLKNIVKLEHQIGDKSYQFICDNDAPLTSVKETLVKFIQYVGTLEDQIIAQQKTAQENDSQIEEKKPEE
jgi:hypothetical protein